MHTPKQNKHIVITVDGTAASGKSTLAKKLAQTYGAMHIPYNAMFRLIADQMIADGYVPDGREPTPEQLQQALTYAKQLASSPDLLRTLKEAAANPSLGREDVSHAAPIFARMPELLHITDAAARHLIETSRRYQHVVIEGRTLGKWIYPEADVKFFVEAELGERAYRRTRGLNNDGFPAEHKDVQENIQWRDEVDQTRKHNPATFDDEIHIPLDTTNNTPDHTLEIAKEIIEDTIAKKFPEIKMRRR